MTPFEVKLRQIQDGGLGAFYSGCEMHLLVVMVNREGNVEITGNGVVAKNLKLCSLQK